MKKKRGILVALILLAILAAGVWIFSRPDRTVVIKGYLPLQDVAAIKSLVKKDMARRLLPDHSWASFKSLTPDIRAYFRYHILEINSRGTYDTRVEVGDGATVASSKHVCEYLLRKDAKGWSVVVIFSASLTSSRRARFPVPYTNRAALGPFAGATVSQGAVRTGGSNTFSFTNSALPFPTNLAVPHMTLGAGSAWRNFPPSSPPTIGALRSVTNDSALVLRPPSTTGYIGGAMTVGARSNSVPRMTTFGARAAPPGVTFPGMSGSLTNLMPLGN